MALSPDMNVMVRAAEKAGRSLVRDFGEVEQLQVSRKGPADFVSAADRRAEEIIHAELTKARPDYGLLMEERGEAGAKNAESRFIVDPLDGTSNFLHGVPHWSVSIGLERGGEVVAGFIYDPVKDESFRAEKGGGAFMRNRRLRVSSRSDMEYAFISGGSCQVGGKENERFLNALKMIMARTRGFRRLGSAALDMAYVAAGRIDAFWQEGLSPWDVAAGSIIVREAGGSVTDIYGKDDPVYCKRLLASNQAIHNEIKNLLGEAGKNNAGNKVNP